MDSKFFENMNSNVNGIEKQTLLETQKMFGYRLHWIPITVFVMMLITLSVTYDCSLIYSTELFEFQLLLSKVNSRVSVSIV